MTGSLSSGIWYVRKKSVATSCLPDYSPAADCVHKYFLEQLSYSKLVLLLLTWITHASWLPIKSHHFGHKQACYFTVVDTQYQACKFGIVVSVVFHAVWSCICTYNCMPQRQPGWIQKFLRRGGGGSESELAVLEKVARKSICAHIDVFLLIIFLIKHFQIVS